MRPFEPPGPAAQPRSAGQLVAEGRRWSRAHVLELAAILLIVGGCVWALMRGLSFFGVSPVHVAYDLDQPPLLLLIVGGWILYRGRPR